MDLFEEKNVKPMLIGEEGEPFDSPDFIYELKLDGERCIAFLEPGGTELRNKRNMKILPKVPELSEIHKQVSKRCILDGELFVMKNGKPDFYEIQRRSLMSNKIKIELASKKYPASFVAYDILYLDGKQLTDLSLMQRKELLSDTISETERLAVSRYIEEKGTELYKLAEQNDLEGIVAKRKDSKYYLDKRTKDWIKIKYLKDDDFVVCGYIEKENSVVSIVLGQYNDGKLIYKGHVTMGISNDDFRVVRLTKRLDASPFDRMPNGNETAIWLDPKNVCIVKYMMKTDLGSLRQPVFKGLRFDKSPQECTEKLL